MICDAKWDEEPVGRKYNQNYTSIYPSENIKNRTFTSCDEVFRALYEEALEIGYYKQQTFIKVEMKVDGKMEYIFKCRKTRCKAILRFQRIGSSLILHHFHNIHSHRFLLYLRRARTEKIMKYLSSLPAEDCVQFYNNALQNKFNLTKRIARYFSRKVFWKFKEIDQLFVRLQELNAKFRRDSDNQILVVCSETMRKNYLIYGDLISFDITYKLIKRSKKIKNLGVGFVVGQDQNKRIVMFSICATHNQTTQCFKTIFAYFFQCIDDVMPMTILTDDQRALVAAIQALKKQRNYPYSHMLDWYHKMQNLKKRLTRATNRDILFALYVRLLKQVSKQVFMDIIKQIIQFSDGSELLEEFLREENKYCMSKVDCSFFGLGINSTRSQSLNNLIKRAVPNQTSTQKMIFIVFRVELRLLRNMSLWHKVNPELLTHINDQCIRTLSEELEIKIFDQVLEVYWLSRQLFQLEKIDAITYKIHYEKYDRPYYFILKFDVGASCWRCSCKSIFKSGAPCAHIGHLINKFGGCIGYYINQRWLHSKHQSERIKLSYPKISYNTSRMRKLLPVRKEQEFQEW